MIKDWSDVDLMYLLEVVCDSLHVGGEHWPEPKRKVLILLIEEVKHKLATSNQQPATSNQQPATSNQQPATSNQQPATSNQQPATE